jgi:hypothetical protein
MTLALKHALPVFLLLSLALSSCASRPAAPPPAAPAAPAPPLWTDAERAECVTFWSRPGRMRVSFAPPRATLTPEASVWFSAWGRALRTAPPAEAVAWKTWTDAKFAHDRWEAAQLAGASPADPEPPLPGLIPAALLRAAGDPPPLSAALVPKRYVISLDDGPPLTYVAPIAVSPRYPSYRSAEGVISGGASLKGMPTGALDGLMRAAGLTPFEAHVVGAVSRLEGGFDAVNTYDTGFVSVGFIQFITAAGGDGSLASVLAAEKANAPTDFARDFHVRGIDVTPGGLYAALNPATGAELTGPEAVQKTIHDPRLVAVFQAAGRSSMAFRIAQIQTAKRGYYPAADPITVRLPGGATLTGHIGDVLRSEAGMATAFDRKVNTGHAAPEVAAAVASVMAAHELTTLADVAPYEREVITALKYRADFLADKTLTQPPVLPDHAPAH